RSQYPGHGDALLQDDRAEEVDPNRPAASGLPPSSKKSTWHRQLRLAVANQIQMEELVEYSCLVVAECLALNEAALVIKRDCRVERRSRSCLEADAAVPPHLSELEQIIEG